MQTNKEVINPMTDEEYIKSAGNKCPYCKSVEIETTCPVQTDDSCAWQNVKCNDCEYEWQDIYNLAGYQPDTENVPE